jgi:hypothetical protein
MAADAGPIQGEAVNSLITAPQPAAAEPISAATSSQPAAAVIIGPDPGPAYIRPELISGGKAPKSNVSNTYIASVVPRADVDATAGVKSANSDETYIHPAKSCE